MTTTSKQTTTAAAEPGTADTLPTTQRTAVATGRPLLLRFFSGLLVDGQEIGVEMVPATGGRIWISVRAYPALTGFKDACRLGDSEVRHEFGLGGIQLIGAKLECMASDEYAPIYRAGFSVILEVGMADLIRPHLASLARISVVSDAIERRLDALMDGPHSHMHDFVTGLVARLVLDGDALPQAMAQEIASHWAGQNAAYMAHFEDEQIQVLLATAVPPELLGRSLKALAGA